MKSRSCVFSLIALSTLCACGGGTHEAIRPEQPTAAEATGRTTVPAVTGPASPLVVDWKAEQRADLEEAIHDGIAVVAWNEDGLRLLKGCKVTGNYGYLPVQVKRDVVRLETADDVQANLPLGGLGLVGKIGAGFSQGTTLDIALAMVGKRRTTWNEVTREDLSGKCDGATHYVRAILVGAFAMTTGTRAKAEAAAEIFGAGASGQSSSAKKVNTSDGKLSACEQTTGDETQPPQHCAAILRLELEPVVEKDSTGDDPKETKEVKSDTVAGCPPGFVFSDGACKKGGDDRPHACTGQDPSDCAAQCEKGDLTSCDRSGMLIAQGKAGAPDPAAALSAFGKACAGGHANGCANMGILLLRTSPQKSMATFERGCALGSARACEVAGELRLYGHGPVAKDLPEALRFFIKGCEGGDFVACTNAGFMYTGGGGDGVPRDDVKALSFSRRACYGGNGMACGNAGYKVELGQSVAADPKSAAFLYARACRLDPTQCFRIGYLFMTGAPGIPKDDAKAKQLLDLSCARGEGLSKAACVVSEKVYGGTAKGSPTDHAHTVKIMTPQCDQKEGRACSFLGIAHYGMGNKADSAKRLRQACSYKDPLGCFLAKKLK